MSDELMNAKDLGYKFKVLKGYIFEGSARHRINL